MNLRKSKKKLFSIVFWGDLEYVGTFNPPLMHYIQIPPTIRVKVLETWVLFTTQIATKYFTLLYPIRNVPNKSH